MKRRDPAPDPVVTDHALLRYIGRVAGGDVQSHRRAVEALVADAVAQGAAALIHDGMRYRINDFRVTTVVPVKSDPAVRVADGDEA